jgi:hypothetical protein
VIHDDYAANKSKEIADSKKIEQHWKKAETDYKPQIPEYCF